VKLLQDPNLFPKIILVLYACSSARYLVAKDYGRSLYWFSAAMITVSVTFFKFKS
jgi:hypothetical protein